MADAREGVAASELRSYADQLPVVLSVPNLARKLREAADEIDSLREVEEAARQLVRRDIPMSVVALCEANLLAARREANMSDATSRFAARVEEWKERDIAACQSSSTSMARLRLSPEADTLSPGSDEGGVHFYESSITRSTGERLLSIVSLGRGMRLTTAQARELHDWIGAWLDPANDAATKPVVTVANRGVHLAYGEWVAWCACGFLETGWPNYEIAKASLSKHVERCERGR